MTGNEREPFKPGVEHALARLSKIVVERSITGERSVLKQPSDRIAAMRENIVIPARQFDGVKWTLPPSKSHLIRWLVMAAQSEGSVNLILNGEPGEDAASVARSLDQMGVKVDFGVDRWTVHGVGRNNMMAPKSVLNLDDCGTGLRILTAIAARFDKPVMLDGNASLRNRPISSLRAVLSDLGCELSSGFDAEKLPLLIKGPIDAALLRQTETEPVELDISRSSQPLTALLMCGATLTETLHLRLIGDAVSSEHAALSMRIAEETGAVEIRPSGGLMAITPWRISCPKEVQIPNDRSQEAFGILLSTLHGVDLEVIGRPDTVDSLGCEILDTHFDGRGEIDLSDASDLISPLAAILSLTTGGRIVGASHARGKESDRLARTVEVLDRFGIDSNATDYGLELTGGQRPSQPAGVVDTHADHRLHMTAACLATAVGSTLSDSGIHAVSDPGFLDRVLEPRV